MKDSKINVIDTKLPTQKTSVLERDERLKSFSTDGESARPDLNSAPTNNNRVPDMNEGGEDLLATSAGTLGGAAVGVAMGLVGGPPGALVGGIIGGVVGGIAGNDIAQNDHPSDEDNYKQQDSYWRENFDKTPYYQMNREMDYEQDYRMAYRLGYESRLKYHKNIDFIDVENDLKNQWEQIKGQSRLKWEEARFAVKDAWNRANR